MQYATELSLCVLAVIFPGERGLAGYIEAKDDGSGNDSWSHKSCKAPVISSQPTSNTQPFTGWMPFMLPSQQHQSTEGKYHILQTCSSQGCSGSYSVVCDTNSSWLLWGMVAVPLISPLMPVPKRMQQNCLLQFRK